MTNNMLDNKEYEILNKIIKDIYKTKTSENMRREVLERLKEMISFNLSIFSLGVTKANKAFLVDSITVSDFDKNFEDEFMIQDETQFDVYDYGAWLFQIPESVVYRDSDIINRELRKKTRYYKDYLLANDLPHIAGLSIVVNEEFMGALTLYKSSKAGDFTDKDMFILKFLLPHLETRLYEDEQNDRNNKKNVSYILKNNYRITSREIELMGHVLKGKTNDEIAQMLVISNNTVKKHLTHIYEKLEVSNRAQLIQFLLDNQMAGLWEMND